ncbi:MULTISPECIES: universal stress protein [Rhodococcus]|jgi:nucleotide-binding universal stress UspA family protein|uniref:Universal stress protein n=1 Tax=Rhodococcus baikonurensis TaxID=172041 RepID=A0ABV5XEL5_9NOCA|nr:MULTISPECIES: universal stress protein [Rhodococcus]KLN71519.1 universal stress protein [Rhodococcus erythropolis]KSU65019.1 universal stress protein [Rhodococcus qingshengii]KZF17857.1 universal stress protein [Rhodococcus sp. EPR-134]SCC70198.1 Nucleotide-binding universal stress protein, UspA family [Rhodococcus qingshengii]
MTAYRTIVVGTDGSESSLRAVEKAAALAADESAALNIVVAYHPESAQALLSLDDQPRSDHDADAASKVLRSARSHANALGIAQVETRLVAGNPVEVLLALVLEVDADMLVVGNRGLNSLSGRLLGSVPADLARRAPCDVLIVHTVH